MYEKHEFAYSADAFETANIKDYSCPICGGTDRDRLMALYVRQSFRQLNLRDRFRFVDFAPSFALTELIKQYQCLDYRSADLYREDVDDRVDVTDMRIYGDASVDYFICSHVLEHIVADEKAMNELFRILKPSGWGIIMVPIVLTLSDTYEDFTKTTEEERWRHFGQGDHVRLYARQSLVGRLKKAGFTVQQLGVDYFGAETFKRAGILDRSVLYVVTKN